MDYINATFANFSRLVMKRTLLWISTAIALQGVVACAVNTSPTSATTPSESKNQETNQSSLSTYHWLLQPDFDPKRDPIQLTFQNQRLTIKGLCNNVGAAYTVDGSSMSINQAVSTMRMCDDPALMDYEQKVSRRLEDVTSWQIATKAASQTPELKLSFRDGTQWLLQGKVTDEAKYGSVGETVFLEVQPQLAPCPHPLMANKQCLKVRTISYDAAGIKQSAGPWQLLYNDIEGYTHEAGTRSIVRVKRYLRTDAPADGSAHVYVLDMVVESESSPS